MLQRAYNHTFMAEPELVSGSTSMLTLNGGLKLYVLLQAAQDISLWLQRDAQLPYRAIYRPQQAVLSACTIAVVEADLNAGEQFMTKPYREMHSCHTELCTGPTRHEVSVHKWRWCNRSRSG